jgi:hypothetical protein
MQMNFRLKYGQDPPEQHVTMMWHRLLLETGSVLRNKEAVIRKKMWKEYKQYDKLINQASHKLSTPLSTLHDSYARLWLRFYKIQIIQNHHHHHHHHHFMD